MPLHRKAFIRQMLLASATVHPAVSAIARTLRLPDTALEQLAQDVAGNDPGFHLLDKNLLNLHVYFINTHRKGQKLYQRDRKLPSFMIVRLPQMHITERGSWAGVNFQPAGRLSGYSYLAFQLWAGRQGKPGTVPPSMVFDLNTLLGWNNRYHMKLVTLLDWFELKNIKAGQFNFVNIGDVHQQKNWSEDSMPVTTTVDAARILAQYRSIVLKLFNSQAPVDDGAFVPVTFFEAPERAFLVPFCPTGPKAVQALFWANRLPAGAKISRINDKGPYKYKRRYELWQNTLGFRKVPEEGKEEQFEVILPHFRIVGFRTKKATDAIPLADTTGSTADCQAAAARDQARMQSESNFLPTLLDKEELSFLTQYAAQHLAPDFNIRELNGFFYTGLGLICHLKYENVDKKPQGSDLVEYEHIIHQGRDIFIKVARLGYNVKTGQRYKHVIEGKRVIDEGTAGSFVELKQYCECIDLRLNLLNKDIGIDPAIYHPIGVQYIPSPADQPATAPCHYRRSPFVQVENKDKERIPIDCLTTKVEAREILNLQCQKWFWPILAKNYPNPAGEAIPLSDYVPCEYEGTDHENQPVRVRTPFMFVRASLVESNNLADAYTNYFLDSEDVFRERKRTYLQNQKVAYKGPVSSPAAAAVNAADEAPAHNKVNVIETDYFVSYFCARKIAANELVGGIPNVVYAQLLYIHGYLDHVRDLTQRRLPSYIEHHPLYIDHGADDEKNNYGRQIFKHTAAFIAAAQGSPLWPERSAVLTALREAKDKLGNVITPDIVPDSVSEKYGITLPPKATFTDNTSQRSSLVPFAVQKKAAAADLKKLMSPVEFLAGELSNAMGGLDLRAILNEWVPEEESPLFKLNKVLEGVREGVIGSPLYQQIVNYKMKDPFDPAVELTPGELIEKYENRYREVVRKIETAKRDIETNMQLITAFIQHTPDLRNLVKSELEAYMREAWSFTRESLWFSELKTKLDKFRDKKVKPFMEQQKYALRAAIDEKLQELEKVRRSIDETMAIALANPDIQRTAALLALINRLNANNPITFLKNTYGSWVGNLTNVDAKLQQSYNAFLGTLEENAGIPLETAGSALHINTRSLELVAGPAGGDVRQFLTFPAAAAELKKIGTMQMEYKLSDLETIILRNSTLGEFQKKYAAVLSGYHKQYREVYEDQRKAVEKVFVTELQQWHTDIRKWQNDMERELANAAGQLGNTAVEQIGKLRAFAEQAHPYIDFILQLDPYHHYQEYKRLKKDIQDVYNRFGPAFIEKYGEGITTLQKAFSTYKQAFDAFALSAKTFADNPGAAGATAAFNEAKAKFADAGSLVNSVSNELLFNVVDKLNIPGIDAVKEYAKQIRDKRGELVELFTSYKEAARQVEDLVKKGIKDIGQHFEAKVKAYIADQERQLHNAIGEDNVQAIQETIAEAKNIYRMLTSLSKQELTYKWNTGDFRDVTLGIISFKKFTAPETELQVDVQSTVHFEPGRFPPVVQKTEVYTENRLRNFGLGLFNAITIGFHEVNFVAGTGRATHFGIKIKDIRFDGALSFVQAFESYLKTMGDGLILKLEADHVALGYSLPLPAIQTPAISFFNLSVNFDFRLHFDKRPMRFGFSISRPESKFGIAAGIYAGFGYFGIVGEPKAGIVEMGIALEAGVWAGLSLGIAKGHAKLAFGFSYNKNLQGVRLEGYITAEGQLGVWGVQIGASIYLGVISENSYVEGRCTVSYSIKIGFIKKSFSSSYYKKIAGAESRNQGGQTPILAAYFNAICTAAKQDQLLLLPGVDTLSKYLSEQDEQEVEIETNSVAEDQWKKFIQAF